jgi:hypothetical protein
MEGSHLIGGLLNKIKVKIKSKRKNKAIPVTGLGGL